MAKAGYRAHSMRQMLKRRLVDAGRTPSPRVPGHGKRNQERGASANGATWVVDIWVETRSTTEGTVEERGEEVLGLTQRLALHRTEALVPRHEFGKVFLLGGGHRRHRKLF